MLGSAIAPNGFSLSREALVAIATGLLALATWFLAKRTAKLAKGSSADLRAQWRPVVIPDAYYLRMPVKLTGDELRFKVRNSGRGPALYVRAGITVEPGTDGPSVEPADPTGIRGALAPGDTVVFKFKVRRSIDRCDVLIDYEDLADRSYSSRILIGRMARKDAEHDLDALLVTDTLLNEDESQTPWPRPDYRGSGGRYE